MMRIPLHSILTAFIGNFVLTTFVLTYVQPHDQIVLQAVPNTLNDDSKIQEDVQNLFNSVVKKDARKSEVYRERLVKEVARERQDFGAMKEQLQSTQNKNAQRRSSLYRNVINIEKSVLVKREIDENEKRRRELDDAFVAKYGTDRMTSGVWSLLDEFMTGDPLLGVLAGEAHREAGLGEAVIGAAVKESRWLDFYDPQKYNFVKIDVLVYTIEGYVKKDTHIPYFFYITKGLKPDCVHYLTKDNLEAWRLTLDRHVCGIQVPTPTA